eukprot:CAMPEP_0181233842 /NCGR_PEP_ID=MMETSP1096-20121128/36590_1 /TAXON_ID=156174 ORGANISM="Chrysochromulina ericina, Strain CCMP281" /NCGR_SAMPLE_ID=MMETSP1096 /ASSEMBLY_ACC=CAM_ASM_000453 /LENGTH=54 /DNA_ID=CAMNT_0023328447 /DNA_START=109 /DNA_END=273 /DNA_ORIENTATION=-
MVKSSASGSASTLGARVALGAWYGSRGGSGGRAREPEGHAREPEPPDAHLTAPG